MTTSLGRAPDRRMLVVAGLLLAAFGLLGLRLAHITVVKAEELRGRADQQHWKTVRVAAPRGAILDRNRRTLAHTVGLPSIYASPKYNAVAPQALPRLAALLDLSPEELQTKLRPTAGFAWLGRRIDPEKARAIDALNLPGVGTMIEPSRRYPKGILAAHVLGTAAGADLRGREGVELRYDELMRGAETVLRVERDGRGHTLLTRAREEAVSEVEAPKGPTPGATLELTIDALLQAMVQRELAIGVEKARADAGTAIVLDPKSGAILALANVPTFDPNHPGGSDKAAVRNRAVTDSFEPGSTFKPFTVAAALDVGAVRVEDRIDCEEGAFSIGRRTIHDHHRYSLLTVPEVIQFSSNIGTTKIAMQLGRERFADYVKSFGFGRMTSIDLPGEVPGIVRAKDRWAMIDLATGSFGQGISTTPIQLAAAFGAIANGGKLYQPYVLERAVDDGRVLLDWNPEEREAAARRVVQESTASVVGQMLESAVSGGTGKKAQIEGVRVAGKTGTAQKVDSKTRRYSQERLASFIGYAPADDPVLVTLVMIDNPRGVKYGGEVAAPVFREITERTLDHLGRRPRLGAPLPRRTPPSPSEVAAAPRDGVPSFLGLSLRRALERAHDEGIPVEVSGTGYVKVQDPAPGTALQDAGSIRLALEPVA
ncbi:MAG: PASTA domain-containing protein [Deltaproteobacteria bacterium]|nr:PASTA domain-containing protein [Deltaproteobacteria bacterium]